MHEEVARMRIRVEAAVTEHHGRPCLAHAHHERLAMDAQPA